MLSYEIHMLLGFGFFLQEFVLIRIEGLGIVIIDPVCCFGLFNEIDLTFHYR